MTGRHDFHTSIFDFATATIALAGDEVSRYINIAYIPALNPIHRRCCSVISDNTVISVESREEINMQNVNVVQHDSVMVNGESTDHTQTGYFPP